MSLLQSAMQLRGRAFALLGALALAGVTAPAQKNPGDVSQSSSQPRGQTLYLNAREVSLDVVVTDAKRNLFTELNQSDFKIYEDGVLQTIRSFTPPDVHKMPANTSVVTSSADLARIGDAPVTILVLDELNTRFEDMAYAREALSKYLRHQPAQLLQPTVLMTVSDEKFDVIHDYSQERDALLTALERHFPSYPYRKMKGGPIGIDASERMARALGSLIQIAQSSTGTRGRKNVIWVGCGFPSLSTDQDSMNSKRADELNQVIRDTTQALLVARVTLNVIDPTMMASSVVDTSDPDIVSPQDMISATDESGRELFPSDINFIDFAPATGGFAYSLRNDVDREIADSIQHGSNYFTLTYSPTNHSDAASSFRKIRIVMSRPGLVANTRNGYYSEKQRKSDERPIGPTTKKLAFDLITAALSRIDYNGLKVRVDVEEKGYSLRIPASSLDFWTRPDGVTGAEVTIMTVCFDSHKRVLSHTSLELTARLPAEVAQEISFKVPVTASPKTVHIRFVVRDAVDGKIGTVDVSRD